MFQLTSHFFCDISLVEDWRFVFLLLYLFFDTFVSRVNVARFLIHNHLNSIFEFAFEVDILVTRQFFLIDEPGGVAGPADARDIEVEVEARVGCVVGRAGVDGVAVEEEDLAAREVVRRARRAEARAVLERHEHAERFVREVGDAVGVVVGVPRLLGTARGAVDEDGVADDAVLEEASARERVNEADDDGFVGGERELQAPAVGIEDGAAGASAREEVGQQVGGEVEARAQAANGSAAIFFH